MTPQTLQQSVATKKVLKHLSLLAAAAMTVSLINWLKSTILLSAEVIMTSPELVVALLGPML
jgi:hypothetical protein